MENIAYPVLSENSADPDQLASEKPADLDLYCFQNRIYLGFNMVRVNPVKVSEYLW